LETQPNKTILDTIKQLKTLGVTKVGFTGGQINYVEMANEKPSPELDATQFKKAVEEMEEEQLYYSA
jgi:hypothetical protein